MKKYVLFFTVLLVTLTASNCKKNSSETPPASSYSYQPVTAGSEWNYTASGTTTGTFKITATNTDTTINSKTYRICTNSGGSNSYYCKSGNDYYRFDRFAELNNEALELLYLKDAAVGDSWTETKIVTVPVTGLGTVPVTVRLTFTIAAKGTTHIVGSTTYNDVIKITAAPSFTTALGSIQVQSYNLEYYYAKNIGLVHSITALNIPLASVTTNTETKLTSYTIK